MRWSRVMALLVLGAGLGAGLLRAQTPLIGERRHFQLVPHAPIPLTGAMVGFLYRFVAHPTRPLFFVAGDRPPELYVFSADGRFLRRLGSQGEGPGEYLSPPQITVWGDTLLLRGGPRVAAYQISTGRLLADPFIPSLPGPFAHWLLRPQRLILYWRRQRRPALVEVLDLASGRFTHALDLPTLTPAHYMLLGYAGSGGLALLGDSLVLATPADEPHLYYLDLRSGRQGSWLVLQDPDFQVDPSPPDLEELARQGRWRAYREQFVGYLTSNSRTCGLFVLENGYLVVQLEHGPSDEERWLRLIVVDPRTRAEVDRITFPASLRLQHGEHARAFMTARGNCLYLRYFWAERDAWALRPWCLEPIRP